MPIFTYRGVSPKIHDQALVSPLATIIGDVQISEGASLFPGAVLRGDTAKITIGKYSNIQDNVVLHGGSVLGESHWEKSVPKMKIGEYVTVAHGSVVHGSTVERVSMVGINAVVYGSTVGEGSIIGMNATVLENTNIPPRSVVVGVPAKVVKKVRSTTCSRMKRHAERYYQLAKSHQGTIF